MKVKKGGETRQGLYSLYPRYFPRIGLADPPTPHLHFCALPEDHICDCAPRIDRRVVWMFNMDEGRLYSWSWVTTVKEGGYKVGHDYL